MTYTKEDAFYARIPEIDPCMMDPSMVAVDPPPKELVVIPREEWNGPRLKEDEIDVFEELLVPPVDNLILSYTETPTCYALDDCKKAVYDIYSESIKKGLYDIPYNFLVGGDGVVYEGRGWKRKPQPIEDNSDWNKDSIEIAHFGFKVSIRNKTNRELKFDPLRIVYRQAWDDSRTLPVPPPPPTDEVSSEVSSSGLVRMEHPINVVIFSYTRTDTCKNFQECKLALQKLLQECREKKLYDIPYNYIIGGDGLVYEVRGWMRVPEPNKRYPNTHGYSLEIANMGPDGASPPLVQAVASWDLVQYFVKANVCGLRPVFLTDYR